MVPDYVKRLSRKGVTVKSLHEEYLREHPDGYLYSNFKRAIRQYKYQVRPVGYVEHPAGDQMYIDYAGGKLEIVDAETDEIRSVEVFVAILPCSHYTYCEAVWSQKGGVCDVDNIVEGTRRTLSWPARMPFISLEVPLRPSSLTT